MAQAGEPAPVGDAEQNAAKNAEQGAAGDTESAAAEQAEQGAAKGAESAAADEGGAATPVGQDVPSGRTTAIGAALPKRTWTVAGGLAAVLVALICLGCGGLFGEASPTAETSSAVPAAPSASAAPPATTPQAATRGVRSAADLDRVCGNTYFPTAPRYRGRAPHPIVISARERLDLGDRSQRIPNRFAYSGSVTAKNTWAPAAKQAQLVACLDLIGAGAKVRDCRTGPANAPKLPLMTGRYQLTVIEVATGRKLAQSTLTGSGTDCPWVAMTGSDPTLYTTVDDRQLHRALQARVTQDVQPKKRS